MNDPERLYRGIGSAKLRKVDPRVLPPPPTAFTPVPVRLRVAGMKQILLMLALVALNLPAFAAGTFIGKVTKVTDGDTINVLTTDNKLHKIRLEGIFLVQAGRWLPLR